MSERPDRELEVETLREYLGSLLAITHPSGLAGRANLPLTTGAPAIVVFVALNIARGFLQGAGDRIFKEIFGDSSSYDLKSLIAEVLASMRRIFKDVLQQHEIDREVARTEKALEDLFSLVAQHLTNPPPAGPSDRIRAANLRALDLVSALARLKILGLHNYMIANGCYLLVLTERAVIDGDEEMRNACRQLRIGIAHAERMMAEWRRWSDLRVQSRLANHGPNGEPTMIKISFEGQTFRADGVRGWYRLNHEGMFISAEEEETYNRDISRAKEIVWERLYDQNQLGEIEKVIREWKELKEKWATDGHCVAIGPGSS